MFFQDVFAEPEGSHSIDGVWRTSFKAFVNTKFWCYRIITAILGIPTAVLCGIYFACLSFDYVWCIMPCLKAYVIELQCLGKVFGLCLRTFCDPFFESVAKIFGGIKVSTQTIWRQGTMLSIIFAKFGAWKTAITWTLQTIIIIWVTMTIKNVLTSVASWY